MVPIHITLKINNNRISALDKSLRPEFIHNTMIDNTWSVTEVDIAMEAQTKEEDNTSNH